MSHVRELTMFTLALFAAFAAEAPARKVAGAPAPSLKAAGEAAPSVSGHCEEAKPTKQSSLSVQRATRESVAPGLVETVDTEEPDPLAPPRFTDAHDLFVVPAAAILRDAPRPDARVLARIASGTRLRAVADDGGAWLRVASPQQDGWMARELVTGFLPGAEGTDAMAVVGRQLASNPGLRPLAAGLLLRAAERCRGEQRADAALEVLVGETAEALAAAGGPFPEQLEIVPAMGTAKSYAYGGEAFVRALESTGVEGSGRRALRERALAGVMRAEHPATERTWSALGREIQSWRALLETAQTPAVLEGAAERYGTAALSLGRVLLALGHVEELGTLETRTAELSGRLAALLPQESSAPETLLSRAEVLGAMRGNGGVPFPQQVTAVAAGPSVRVSVRIAGRLGELLLTANGREIASPVLPVPGSLRVSPDGKSAAWLEVAAPGAIVPVLARLDGSAPPRELAFTAGSRPLRDRRRRHVVGSLDGFSRDGTKLAFTLRAWQETAPRKGRLNVVAATDGRLLYEGPDTRKGRSAWERALR